MAERVELIVPAKLLAAVSQHLLPNDLLSVGLSPDALL
jgi:hypothetical protein